MTTANYSNYSERRLLDNLASARNKITLIQNEKKALEKKLNAWLEKESKIKKALKEKYVPNKETIKAMKKCETISKNDDIVKVEKIVDYLKELAQK